MGAWCTVLWSSVWVGQDGDGRSSFAVSLRSRHQRFSEHWCLPGSHLDSAARLQPGSYCYFAVLCCSIMSLSCRLSKIVSSFLTPFRHAIADLVCNNSVLVKELVLNGKGSRFWRFCETCLLCLFVSRDCKNSRGDVVLKESKMSAEFCKMYTQWFIITGTLRFYCTACE